MPVFNAKRTIDEAIRSVLGQGGVAFELLVGDDASRDSSWKRIQAYQGEKRLKAWRFPKRLGAARARNALIARARGLYLAICDADDRMLPGHLRRLSRVLDRRPQVGVVHGDQELIGPAGRRLERKRVAKDPQETWDLLEDIGCHAGSMLRRSLVRKVGGYRPYRLAHDYDLFLRLAEVTQFHVAKGRPTYCRRKLPGSLSGAPEDKSALLRIWRDAIFRRYGVRLKW